VVDKLTRGEPPIYEPGLAEQVRSALSRGLLSFETSLQSALSGAKVVWVAFDTPVDENDAADCESVKQEVYKAISLIDKGAVVLVSSQLPAGSLRELQAAAQAQGRGDIEFASSPENLRLGQALKIFSDPDRVVCGVGTDRAKAILAELWAPITDKIEWMGIESAEMTKHAINAFLAVSISFANELAGICESVGADVKQVERGLKTEKRIGPGAYLGPGQAFAGGTLARDLAFLDELGTRCGRPPLVAQAARSSNDRHKCWVVDRLTEKLGDLSGVKIALWGLAYKVGTDTLRRSSALENAQKLLDKGAVVSAHDPAVKSLDPQWSGRIELSQTALGAAAQARALVLGTPWPQYKEVGLAKAASVMARPLIVDPGGFFRPDLEGSEEIEYLAIGYFKDQSRPLKSKL
jgi:UDPglucose 6-dehydrogenase